MYGIILFRFVFEGIDEASLDETLDRAFSYYKNSKIVMYLLCFFYLIPSYTFGHLPPLFDMLTYQKIIISIP